MKKCIAGLITFVAMASSAFAFSMGTRFVDFSFQLPVGITNSGVGLNDIMQEEAVLDLNQMYKNLPDSGLNISFFAAPEFDFTVDFRKGKAGFAGGLDTKGSVTLSKDIFRFLAEGNGLNETITEKVDGSADAFMFYNVTAGFKVRKLEVEIVPSVFLPLVHMETVKCNGTFENTSDGSFNASTEVIADIYSCLDLVKLMPTEDSSGFSIPRDNIAKGAGVDLGISAKYALLEKMKITGSFQCPIVPGTLFTRQEYTVSGALGFNVMNMDKKADPDDASGIAFNAGDVEKCNKSINRPLTFMGGMEWTPFGQWLLLKGGIGCGVKYPFSNDAKIYPQYNASATASLWNMLGVTVSTSYMNEVFSHGAALMFNLRLIEIDAGVASSGTNIASTFNGSGVSAFVKASFGF